MPTSLDLFETAWGENDGYVFFSIKDPTKEKHSDGYWRDISFKWPEEKYKVRGFINKAENVKQDVYWAPAMFSKPKRRKGLVLPTDLLWSDLDEVDPSALPPQLRPTASWSTSPGRYAAIWKLAGEPLAPEVQQILNKKLTYKLDADKGGWDLTQVLRVPGTLNHKYKDVRVKHPSINGRAPSPMEMTLALEGVNVSAEKGNDDVEKIPDPNEVLKKKRRRISARAKALLKARSRNAVPGKRSETLWELECLLAEAGLSAPEIVSLIKGSAWNKFSGRDDEDRNLFREARKAIQHTSGGQRVRKERTRPKKNDRLGDTQLEAREEDESDESDTDDGGDSDEDFPGPKTWDRFDREHTPISWIIAEVWGRSEVGFISGHPKSYKSWLALDFAVSVATGTRFLGSFQAKKANVLIVQEEDPKNVIQDRLARIAGSKGLIGAHFEDDELVIRYNLPQNLYVQAGDGFQITDEDWMEHLTETVNDLDIDVVILDPLMMMAEGMDEFKAFDMMAKVLKPLKKLRADTGAAVAVVHHHMKSTEAKGASAMYGSVALWAWEECALHLVVNGPGKITAERFSKHAQLTPLTVDIGDIDELGWKPLVHLGAGNSELLGLIQSYEGGISLEEMATQTNLKRDALTRQLKKFEESGRVEKVPAPRVSGEKGRRRNLWKSKEG